MSNKFTLQEYSRLISLSKKFLGKKFADKLVRNVGKLPDDKVEYLIKYTNSMQQMLEAVERSLPKMSEHKLDKLAGIISNKKLSNAGG